MRVAEVMIRGAFIVQADETIRTAARLMADEDIGFLPVVDDDRMVGVLTDRDIAMRCVARGISGNSSVGALMTPRVSYCFEDDDLDEAVANMAVLQLRRMPVVNRAKRLCGVLSLADVAHRSEPLAAGIALCGVTVPREDQLNLPLTH